MPPFPDPPADLVRRLLPRESLAARCAEERSAGRRIVFTNGCFDLLHLGHASYLAEARALGDLLVVGVNADAGVRRLKGPDRPLVPERDRALLLLALRSVDLACIFPEDTPLELIRVVRPDILAKGGDYRPEEVVGREVVEAHGGSVRIVPFRPGHSTSRLIERLRDGGGHGPP